MAELAAYTIWVPTLMLVIFRVAGIFLTAPLLSNGAIPPVLKGTISVVIGLAVTARLSSPVAMPPTWQALVFAIGREMLVGGVIGYAADLLFVGVNIGGQHISQQMGIGLATVYDPQSQSGAGVLSAMLQMVALAIFLAIGGHRQMLAGFMSTFDTVPLMGFTVDQSLLTVVVKLLTASFEMGVRVAAPVLAALMLASVAMGLIQRTMPQFNILSAGFQIRVIVSLIILAVAVAALVPLIETGWRFTLTQMAHLFSEPTSG